MKITTIPTTMNGKPYLTIMLISTSTRVGAGSVPPRSLNILANTGTMNSSMPMTATIAMQKTTVG